MIVPRKVESAAISKPAESFAVKQVTKQETTGYKPQIMGHGSLNQTTFVTKMLRVQLNKRHTNSECKML